MSDATAQHHLLARGAIQEMHHCLNLQGLPNRVAGIAQPFAAIQLVGGAEGIGIGVGAEDPSRVTTTTTARHSDLEAGHVMAGEREIGSLSASAMQMVNEENASKDESQTEVSSETRKCGMRVCGDAIDHQVEIALARAGHRHFRQTLAQAMTQTLVLQA